LPRLHLVSVLDVIVLGAGASGLKAAADLARAGCSGVLLDARDRIGGRIHTRHEPGLAVPLELGAEFIHGEAPPVFELIAKAAGAAIDTGGERWSLTGGKLERSNRMLDEIQDAMRNDRILSKRDLSFDEFLDRHLKDVLSPEARESARMFAQGFDAADTRRASARAITDEWTAGSSVGSSQFRPLGGYGALLAHLAGELRGSAMQLQLNTEIRSIRWRRGGVEARGTFHGRAFAATAKRAIVALPLGVLQRSTPPGGVRFTPALAQKRRALKHLAPGPVMKVLLRFRRAFWEEVGDGRYRGAAFFHARKEPFPTFWTTLPVRTPVIAAWAAGPKATALAGADAAKVIGEALKSFATIFPAVDVEHMLESASFHDWQTDPYARGAYSYVLVDGIDAREQLAQPLAGTLFFAGEAADCEGEAGTVAGALQSGTRAARELLAVARRR
jgi:monoamine oxidase